MPIFIDMSSVAYPELKRYLRLTHRLEEFYTQLLQINESDDLIKII